MPNIHEKRVSYKSARWYEAYLYLQTSTWVLQVRKYPCRVLKVIITSTGSRALLRLYCLRVHYATSLKLSTVDHTRTCSNSFCTFLAKTDVPQGVLEVIQSGGRWGVGLYTFGSRKRALVHVRSSFHSLSYKTIATCKGASY